MADPELTGWTRLEPRRVTRDPSIGLAARLADPLWLMCRQLQMGEFTGDDGGTPTQIDVTATWVPFTHWSAGVRAADAETTWQAYDRDRPLEALVEDDRALVGGQAPPLLAVVESGQRLERRLRAAGLGELAGHAALDPLRVLAGPQTSTVGTSLHAGRTIDGFAVRGQLGTLRAALAAGLSAAETTQLTTVLDGWTAWFDNRFGYPVHDSAWIEDRLEHRFSLAAPHPDGGALVLDSPEYLGDGIRWSGLELAPGAVGPTDLPADAARQITVRSPYPQSLRWPGMPVDRFWEMEDGSVDLGSIRMDPADLPGLLALDMAVTASTDWLIVEVPLPGAGMSRIDQIVVTDTFGRTTTVLGADAVAIPEGLGLLFAPSASDRSGAGWLALAPRLGARVDGPAREDVVLVHDEMANLGWIVERIGPQEDGEPAELHQPPRLVDPPSPEGSLAYRLSTGAPLHWHPLVPRRREADSRLVLARGQMFDSPDPVPITMLARQIDELLDEEVPREGKRLGRAWQYGRWFDGGRHLWSGRTVNAGRGEASSALRFDDTN